MANAIPFVYGWLVGPDTDNTLPQPLTLGIHDTIHLHELAIFVTNQEADSIEVKFAFYGFVTHCLLQERLEEVNGLILDGAILTAEDLAAHDSDPAAHVGIVDGLQRQIEALANSPVNSVNGQTATWCWTQATSSTPAQGRAYLKAWVKQM